MSPLVPERTAIEAAQSALIAVRSFISTVPDGYRGEPADPEGLSVIIRDLVTSLLHLADMVDVPGDREQLTFMAYFRYREEAAYHRGAGFDAS